MQPDFQINFLHIDISLNLILTLGSFFDLQIVVIQI